MKNIIIYYLIFLFVSFLGAQYSYTPLEVGTAGAYLGGRLGTHAIHSNPALLGVESEKVTEMTPVDTFDISYSIKIASSNDQDELIEIMERLIRDGLDREYIIEEGDSLFSLITIGFNDSFSAYNFSSMLPSSLSEQRIETDTTFKTIYRPNVGYAIQVLATPSKDSLNTFKKRTKKDFKELDTDVVFIDSLYKYQVGFMATEEEAIVFKNSPIIQTVASDAFVTSKTAMVSNAMVPRVSISFPFRFALNMGSNVLSAEWVNNIIGADMVSEPSKKDNILQGIPSSGILGFLGLNAGAFDMTIGNYGISLFNIESHTLLNIPKALTEVVLDGLRFNEPRDISNFDARGLVVNSTTISYGRKIDIKGIPYPTHVGVGLRLLFGTYYYVDSYEGQISTSVDSVNIYSNINMSYLNPDDVASGFGIDLGLQSNINEKFSVQLSFINLGATLKSEKTNVWRSIKNIHLSNEDISKYQDYNETQQDSAENTFSILDETKSVTGKSVPVPSRMNFSTNYIYSNNIHLKGAFQFLMQTKFLGNIDPRFSLGLEVFPGRSYPLLFGMSFGGMSGLTFGSGFGLKLKNFHLDLGFSQSGGIGNAATGFSVSTGMRLLFW